jgi:hypothetical protein
MGRAQTGTGSDLKHLPVFHNKEVQASFQKAQDDLESMIQNLSQKITVFDQFITPELRGTFDTVNEKTRKRRGIFFWRRPNKHWTGDFAPPILDSKLWSLLMNDMWVLANVHAGAIFLCISPLSWYNLWSMFEKDEQKKVKTIRWEDWFSQAIDNRANKTIDNGGPTVTAREFLGLKKFGYTFHRAGPAIVAMPPPHRNIRLQTFNSYRKYLENASQHKQLHDIFLELDPYMTIHATTHVLVKNKDGHYVLEPAEKAIREHHSKHPQDVKDTIAKLHELDSRTAYFLHSEPDHVTQHLNEHPGSTIPIDMRGANMSKIATPQDHGHGEYFYKYDDYLMANLSDIDFEALGVGYLLELDLEGAQLIRANLEGLELPQAYLVNANLTDAKLSNAKLPGAQLRQAQLEGADLQGVDLRGANLKGVSFNSKTNVKGAMYDDTTVELPDKFRRNMIHVPVIKSHNSPPPTA